MNLDDFRRHAHETIDLIVDYLGTIEERPVGPRVAPGEVRSQLPSHPPERPEPFEAVLDDVRRIVLPGLMHWQHPAFFGYFPANASPPAILGELLSAGLGVQGMLWATSPACTEVETHMLDWMADLLALPARFRSDGAGGGVIQDTASSSTLCALLAARERATGFTVDAHGLSSAHETLVAYTSDQAHSSVEKAVRIAGLGRENLRLIETDGHHAMRPEALAAAIDADLDAGRQPVFVCATVGTTSSGAVDPVRAIGDVCGRHGIWLHVDAAWAGSAAVCPEFRTMHDGLERADSYCFNPHKWLLTNFDCDCFYVADRSLLVRTLSVLPEYLRNTATASGKVIDYRDWHIPLGRRFRALKLWFVIRSYGAEGLREHIRRHVASAEALAARVSASHRLELAAPPFLGLVCLRHRDGDEATQRLLDGVNASGAAFLTHTRLGGHLVVRVAIGGTWTREEHVERLWERLEVLAT
ncbi:MAG: aminotransferase class V-fold PLP-dependent enzyme [Phycisphaerales bacterium]|nr:aminotransferase class V-fold PLP-dependent enzyme [Phycisphaerales bacterium]